MVSRLILRSSAGPKIAAITGSGTGIGIATARRFARDGCRLVLNGRRGDKLINAVNEINGLVGSPLAYAVQGDAAEAATIENMLSESRTRWGRIPDVFVANAGVGVAGTILSSDPDRWDELLRINVVGLMRQLRIVAEAMLSSNGDPPAGHPSDIVILGSTIGRNVSPTNSVYGGSKFAVHAVAESLRREVSSRGIRVTVIEPGIVKSEFQEAAGYDAAAFQALCEQIGPVLEPHDVADLIAYVTAVPGHVHINEVMIRPTRQVYP